MATLANKFSPNILDHPTSDMAVIEFVKSRAASFSIEFRACLSIPTHSRHVAINNLMRNRLPSIITDYNTINTMTSSVGIYPLCSLLIEIVDMYRNEVRALTEIIESATQLINFYDSICFLDNTLESYGVFLVPYVRPYFASKSSIIISEPIQKTIVHYKSMCDGYFKHNIMELQDQLLLTEVVVPEWLPDMVPVELVKYPCLLRIAYAYIEAMHNKRVLSRLVDDEFVLSYDIQSLNDETQGESSLLDEAVEKIVIPFVKCLQ